VLCDEFGVDGVCDWVPPGREANDIADRLSKARSLSEQNQAPIMS